MLKPTLSHDDEHIDHKYVDDKGKVHITRLYGFPTAIFNSLDNEYMSEFATRTLTITPTTTPSKIASAIQISNEKSSFPWQYQKISHNKQLIHELIRKIRNVITKEKIQVVNPFPNLRRFFSQSNVRDMRDFNHYLELLPSYTILKLYQRPLIAVEDKNYLVATIQDVIDAKTLFDSIAETTKTGTEQRIINFYNQHVKPKVNGTTINILTDEYNKTHKDRKSSKTISNWMNRLVEIEFVDARKGLTSDGHTITYFPLKGVDVDKNQSDLAEAGIFQQNRTEIEAFLQKDFEEWLKRAEEETPLTPQIIEFNGATRTLSREEFIKIVTSTLKDPISSPQTNNKPSPNEENNAKTVPFSGNRTVTANSPAPADVDQATGTQCTLPEAPIQ